MRQLPIILIALGAMACSLSCREERQSFVPNASDPEAVATMTTTDVSTLISDSGYTRYHITTPIWQMFEDASEPHWKFPNGLQLEQYDEAMRPAANIVCDSAVYFSRKRLWRLDGHVIMVNTLRDSFLTSQLFWDQQREKVYSDSFIHIVRTDRIIEGYGFESNQRMTRYTVTRPTGIIPIERKSAQQTPTDSVDSTATVSQGASARRPAPVRASQRNPHTEESTQLTPTPATPIRTMPRR